MSPCYEKDKRVVNRYCGSRELRWPKLKGSAGNEKAFRLPDREDHYHTDNRIYNGMLGVVIAIDRKEEALYVYYPVDRSIAVYSFDEARELVRPAYALTIHKGASTRLSSSPWS